jgi:hypothetical protein
MISFVMGTLLPKPYRNPQVLTVLCLTQNSISYRAFPKAPASTIPIGSCPEHKLWLQAVLTVPPVSGVSRPGHLPSSRLSFSVRARTGLSSRILSRVSSTLKAHQDHRPTITPPAARTPYRSRRPQILKALCRQDSAPILSTTPTDAV